MAARQGISLQVSVEMPEDLFVEKVDLCSIFSNLLDNAIHAAAQVSENRYVYMAASVFGGCCTIITVNSYGQDSEKPFVSTASVGKADIHGGYGLCILRSIGKKYGGELITKTENGQFTARLILNLTE